MKTLLRKSSIIKIELVDKKHTSTFWSGIEYSNGIKIFGYEFISAHIKVKDNIYFLNNPEDVKMLPKVMGNFTYEYKNKEIYLFEKPHVRIYYDRTCERVHFETFKECEQFIKDNFSKVESFKFILI